MPYLTAKDKAIADLLRKIIITVQDIQAFPVLFESEDKRKYGDELFFARQAGRYQGLLLRIVGDLTNGLTVEDIKLDK
ncbi:MAG: hypothetical protein A2X55_05060 [Nitrospirae bacterium GWB2_47_37]|nr:MAG: hypothetical protein A2X55_05060 [Nitrospirae bacterium GWB2_47_37]